MKRNTVVYFSDLLCYHFVRRKKSKVTKQLVLNCPPHPWRATTCLHAWQTRQRLFAPRWRSRCRPCRSGQSGFAPVAGSCPRNWRTKADRICACLPALGKERQLGHFPSTRAGQLKNWLPIKHLPCPTITLPD